MLKLVAVTAVVVSLDEGEMRLAGVKWRVEVAWIGSMLF